MSRTGILGGSFDPVHIGHVELAKTAAADLKLEKLLVIPAFDPPHKNSCIASFEQRYRMLELSFEGIPKVTVSDIEKRLGGKSYTINTIRALKNELGRTDLYLIIGSDQLYTIEQWYMYGSILKETHTVQLHRYAGVRQQRRTHKGAEHGYTGRFFHRNTGEDKKRLAGAGASPLPRG